MPEQINLSENLPVPESDWERVKTHVEKSPSSLPPEDKVKEAIKSFTPPPEPGSSSDQPDYMSSANPADQTKLKELLDLAKQKGIETAIKAAQKASPFLVDALHDSLAQSLLNHGVIDNS